MHKNLSTSSNNSSPSCTPSFEHTFTYTTVGYATTNALTRLCHSSHETATASMRTCATHTPYHNTGKRSPSSYGSNGQGHGQAPQLQATNEQPEIQKSMEPASSQQIWAIGKWLWRAHKVPTNTIKFIFQHKVPADHMKDVTHGQFVCSVRPKKAEPNQM